MLKLFFLSFFLTWIATTMIAIGLRGLWEDYALVWLGEREHMQKRMDLWLPM